MFQLEKDIANLRELLDLHEQKAYEMSAILDERENDVMVARDENAFLRGLLAKVRVVIPVTILPRALNNKSVTISPCLPHAV